MFLKLLQFTWPKKKEEEQKHDEQLKEESSPNYWERGTLIMKDLHCIFFSFKQIRVPKMPLVSQFETTNYLTPLKDTVLLTSILICIFFILSF